MADPVSLVGTAVGVFSLGIQVCHELHDFVNAVGDRDKQIDAARIQIRNLCSIFEGLRAIVSASRPVTQNCVEMLDDTLMRCIQDTEFGIAELRELLSCLDHGSGEGKRGKLKDVGRRLKFGLRQEKLRALQERVQALMSTTSFALQTLHL